MRSGKRVFIHHDGALGDTLLSLPCVRLIRRSTSCLHFAGRTDVAAFLKDAGIVDEMSSADSRVYSSLHTVTMDDGLAEVLSSYDALYLFTVNGDSQIAANMRRIFPAAAIIKTIPPIGTIEHAAEFRLRQLGYCGEDKETENPIRIPQELTGWAAGVLEDCGYADGEAMIVTVHPGSGGKRKCWPWKSYEFLIRTITADPHIFCVVISGPAEDDQMVKDLSRLELESQRVTHLHQQPLIRIAALLKKTDFYIGNDSGISHLAGVMQCRGVALFGPTDHHIWRPAGNGLEVIQFDTEGTRNADDKIVSEIMERLNPVNGGADGARTRDLRRDRPAF